MGRWVFSCVLPHHLLSHLGERVAFYLQKGRKPNEAQARDAAHPRRRPSLSPLVVLSPVTVFIPFVPRVGKCKITLPVFDESEIWINWNHGANGKRFHVFVLPDFEFSLLMSWFFLPFIFQVRMDRRKASTINIFHCVSHFFIFFLYLCLQLSRNIFFNSNMHFFIIFLCYLISWSLPSSFVIQFLPYYLSLIYCCNQCGQIHFVNMNLLTMPWITFVLLKFLMYKFPPMKI